MNTKTFYSILDGRNKAFISYVGDLEYSPDESYNFPMPTKKLFYNIADMVAEMAEICKKEKLDFDTAYVSDIGCGIGNGGELIARSITDHNKLPELKKVRIVGIEKQEEYAEIARELYSKVTNNYDVIVTDLNSSVNNVLSSVLDRGDLESNETAVVYCDKVFRNPEKQGLLEREILESASIGSYFIFPYGLGTVCKSGLHTVTGRVFRKIGKINFV